MSPGPILLAGHWSPAKRRTLTTHRNDGVEVVYIEKGRLRWHVEGRQEEVPPGSVFFTLPWQEHGSVEQVEPSCVLHFAVVRTNGRYDRPARKMRFERSVGLAPRVERRIAGLLGAARRHCWPANARIAWLLPQLVIEHHRRPASPEATSALARLTLIELARCVEGEALPKPMPPAEQRVQQFLQSLAGRCAEAWTLGTMSEACGLGRTRFADVVKRLTGETPVMALNRLRVARARHLLRATDRDITDIALDCGFGTSQYFAGVFRAYTGCSASAYRG